MFRNSMFAISSSYQSKSIVMKLFLFMETIHATEKKEEKNKQLRALIDMHR